MSARSRLNGPQIAIMRSLFTRGGYGTPISLSRRLQHFVRDLWRRELVQILIGMKAPGCRFLDLAPLGAVA